MNRAYLFLVCILLPQCLLCVILLRLRTSEIGMIITAWLRRSFKAWAPGIVHPKEMDNMTLALSLVNAGKLEKQDVHHLRMVNHEPIGEGRMSSISKVAYKVRDGKSRHVVFKSMPNSFNEQLFTLLFGLSDAELDAYSHEHYNDVNNAVHIPCMLYSHRGIFGSYLFVIEFIESEPQQSVQATFEVEAITQSFVRQMARQHARTWHRAGDSGTKAWCKLARNGPLGDIKSVLTQIVFRGIWKQTKHLQPSEFRLSRTDELIEFYLAHLPELNECALKMYSTSLTHGDLNVGNIVADKKHNNLQVIDWQSYGVRPAVTDLAYFIGMSLPIHTRRKLEDELLRAYAEEVSQHTGINYSVETCRIEFRFAMMFVIVPLLFMGYLVKTDPKGAAKNIESGGRRAHACVNDYAVLDTLRNVIGSRIP